VITAARAGRHRYAAAVAVVALLALGTSACSDSGAGAPVAGGDGQGFVEGDGTVTVIDPADRQAAPPLSGTTLDGKPLDVTALRGDVVVLNVWASWCGPCRGEAPALEAVYQDTRAKGVRFVGINTRDQTVAARAFERGFDITYPSLVDDSGSLLLGFRDTLPPSAIPSTVVLDRKGDVAARVLGPTTYTQLKRLVTQVAAESA